MILLTGLLVAAAVLTLPRPPAHRLRTLLSRTAHAEAPARAGAPSVADSTAMNLVGIAVHAGLPAERALTLVAEATGREELTLLARSLELQTGPETGTASRLAAELGRLLEFSAHTGAPIAPLLHDRAGDLRSAAKREAQIAAARLGVRLVLPLGVCILPAFILLGIVPVVLSLLDEMLAVF